VNAVKADFTGIYRQRDPREYFRVLGSLDYVIPEIAGAVISQLISELISRKGRPITVIDLGCSYGVLSAVMRHGLNMDQLRDRYASPSIASLSSERLANCDVSYFAGWPARPDLQVIGLDCSPEALGYAHRVGLVDQGLVVDLETSSLDARAQDMLAKADLIVSTGVVGYVTEKTFGKLLAAFPAGREPWVASFVLRAFDYRAISATLARRGLATERFASATFVQRRFRDQNEYEDTLRLLQAANIDPAGKESDGLLHAELFLSRPHADAERVGVGQLVSLSSAGAARFRHRLRIVTGDDEELAA